jgi:FKBP-type peptidyl-prolyl cis-trans isomerase FklB
MKLFVFSLSMLLAVPAFSQSKKELAAEVNRLKAEVAQLKKASEPKQLPMADENTKACYGIGVLIGSNLKAQPIDSINLEAIFAGIDDIVQNKSTKLDKNEASQFVQQYMQQAMEKKSEKMKTEGQQFLEQNKSKEGVKVTASGLQYKVVTSGTGKMPMKTDNVTVHYTGKLIDGTVFDSSVERGQPATFGLGQVIPGWTEVLQLMKEGDKFMVYIPYDLAYGERGSPPQILPYSTLIFEIELIKVN